MDLLLCVVTSTDIDVSYLFYVVLVKYLYVHTLLCTKAMNTTVKTVVCNLTTKCMIESRAGSLTAAAHTTRVVGGCQSKGVRKGVCNDNMKKLTKTFESDNMLTD